MGHKEMRNCNVENHFKFRSEIDIYKKNCLGETTIKLVLSKKSFLKAKSFYHLNCLRINHSVISTVTQIQMKKKHKIYLRMSHVLTSPNQMTKQIVGRKELEAAVELGRT